MSITEIRSGRTWRPLRVLVYGAQKVGKTTFASHARAPVLIGNEDGAENIDVAKFPAPSSWKDVLAQVDHLLTKPHDFATVVLDTLDWLEPLCWAHVCEAAKKSSIEDFGYGKGYVAALDEWRGLVARLERLRSERDMTIVALAHAHVRSFQNPAGPDYDRWELAVHKGASGLFVQWVDVVGFAAVEKAVSSDGKGVSTGRRLLYTQDAASAVAGTRYAIENPIELNWATFARAIKDSFDRQGKDAST